MQNNFYPKTNLPSSKWSVTQKKKPTLLTEKDNGGNGTQIKGKFFRDCVRRKFKLRTYMPNNWDDWIETAHDLIKTNVKDQELQKVFWSCVWTIREKKMTPDWIVLSQQGDSIELLWKDDLIILTKDSKAWWGNQNDLA